MIRPTVGMWNFINSSFVVKGSPGILVRWYAGYANTYNTHIPKENISSKSDLNLLIIYRFAVHQC